MRTCRWTLLGVATAVAGLQAGPASAQSDLQKQAVCMNVLAGHRIGPEGRGILAQGSVVAAFAPGLADTKQGAAPGALPTRLAGTRVQVRSAAGRAYAALAYVSPMQVNFRLPAAAVGEAEIAITNARGQVSTCSVLIVDEDEAEAGGKSPVVDQGNAVGGGPSPASGGESTNGAQS